ncbi:hypothetical protein BDZ45DRAFT_678321 [Acephala macrosclerotiorum]|nr:hypothetical protein BDZ45DRAFT_678321 [Acephala macrosclerotiorum]
MGSTKAPHRELRHSGSSDTVPHGLVQCPFGDLNGYGRLTFWTACARTGDRVDAAFSYNYLSGVGSRACRMQATDASCKINIPLSSTSDMRGESLSHIWTGESKHISNRLDHMAKFPKFLHSILSLQLLPYHNHSHPTNTVQLKLSNPSHEARS